MSFFFAMFIAKILTGDKDRERERKGGRKRSGEE
jgi:hypothetical protein